MDAEAYWAAISERTHAPVLWWLFRRRRGEEDFEMVAAISASGARTSGGKNAGGKMLKICSDMYFLLMAKAERRLLVVTELAMPMQCPKEIAGGRVPKSIELIHAELRDDLRCRLVASRKAASRAITVVEEPAL